ncbi:MAG: DNA polymerase I [Planctomycetota bacterium]|nr:DNA polymerase I [Planctomycetota bacterium]
MTARPRLYLIDGTALAYRSYFAFATTSRGGLTTRDGHPTAATFGFTITLRSLLEREKPDHIAVAFDGSRDDLERTKLYPEYKSTREKAPEEMLAQFDDIRDVVEAHGIKIVESPGHEADDVIGTLAVRGREAGMDVFIVTGDKDFMQLVDDQVKLWNLRGSTRAPEILDSSSVVEKFGVKPEQMIDLLALMGDSSDNVPGVPQVGQVKASKLLAQFETLDAALERIDEVKPPSLQKALREHQDLAMLSRQLVTIHTDVPLNVSLDEVGAPAPDFDALLALFQRLEFETLAKTLPRPRIEPDVPQDYRIVRTEAELDELLDRLRKAGTFAVDTETTSLDARHAKIVGVSFADRPGEAFYVPFNLDPPILPGGHDALVEKLRPLLEDPELRKTLQNAKYDLHVFRGAGIEVRGLEFDTMLASYVLSPGIGAHNLDALSLRYFDYQKIPTSELLGTGKKQITFDQVEVDKAGRYAAEDADFTWRLRERMEPELAEAGLRALFDEIEMPLVPVLLAMEAEGIRLDLAHLTKLEKRLTQEIDLLAGRVHERANAEFNLNSPAQVGAVLFDQLEVHRAAGFRPKKTKTGQWKTDAQVLETLAAHHEVPRLILDWRQLTKLRGTYVESLPQMVDPATGRVHTSFNQAVAATGRLSSDNPNLQNIPIRSEWGREVRRAFVSRGPGFVLMSADYSQIELRILAHVAEDQGLIDAFRRGEDVHTRTAAKVHGLLPGMVTPDMRSQAKVINYGLVYGMGPSRLARETGMTPAEAKKFIDAYFHAFPGVKTWLDATLEAARGAREVHTIFGRRRPLPDIDADNVNLRIAAENMAVNTPIQGTAADIIKRAMIRLHAELDARRFASRLLLQVHDELVLDVAEDELREVEILVRTCMQEAAELSVPLEVTLGTGATWLDAH